MAGTINTKSYFCYTAMCLYDPTWEIWQIKRLKICLLQVCTMFPQIYEQLPKFWKTWKMKRSKFYTQQPCILGNSLFCIRQTHYRISRKSTHVPIVLTLILRRSRRGTVWFYTSTSNKRAARPKLYRKSLTRDLKRMYSRFTLVRISINL